MSRELHKLMESAKNPRNPTLREVFSHPEIVADAQNGAARLHKPDALLSFYASALRDEVKARRDLEALIEPMGGCVSGGSYHSDFNLCVPASKLAELAQSPIADEVYYATHSDFPAFRC